MVELQVYELLARADREDDARAKKFASIFYFGNNKCVRARHRPFRG